MKFMKNLGKFLQKITITCLLLFSFNILNVNSGLATDVSKLPKDTNGNYVLTQGKYVCTIKTPFTEDAYTSTSTTDYSFKGSANISISNNAMNYTIKSGCSEDGGAFDPLNQLDMFYVNTDSPSTPISMNTISTDSTSPSVFSISCPGESYTDQACGTSGAGNNGTCGADYTGFNSLNISCVPLVCASGTTYSAKSDACVAICTPSTTYAIKSR